MVSIFALLVVAVAGVRATRSTTVDPLVSGALQVDFVDTSRGVFTVSVNGEVSGAPSRHSVALSGWERGGSTGNGCIRD